MSAASAENCVSYPDLPHIPEIPSHRPGEMTVSQVLNQARGALHGADHALHQLEHHAPTIVQLALIRMIVIECRRSTFVLQKLSSRVDGFNQWYAPLQDAMRADPLMRYLGDLRTQIEKEGLPAAMAELLDRETGVTFADVAVGEDGHGIWVSGALRQGSSVPAGPVANPEETLLLRNFRLPDPPTTHLGNELTDLRFSALASLAVTYLRENVVEPAADRFGP